MNRAVFYRLEEKNEGNFDEYYVLAVKLDVVDGEYKMTGVRLIRSCYIVRQKSNVGIM